MYHRMNFNVTLCLEKIFPSRKKSRVFHAKEGNENSPSDKFEACVHFVNQIYTKQLRR